MRGPGTAKTKQVWCTHCGGPNEVAQRAMSVFCAHCHKRLILENLIVKTYQALKSYATCGDVVVEKNGRIVASVQAGKLTVKGTVQGRIEARGCVEVAENGSLIGDVTAPAVLVRQGASVRGFYEIRPLPTCAADDVPAAAPAAADEAPARKAPRRTTTKTPALQETDSGAAPRPAPAEAKPAPRAVKAIVTARRRSSSAPRR